MSITSQDYRLVITNMVVENMRGHFKTQIIIKMNLYHSKDTYTLVYNTVYILQFVVLMRCSRDADGCRYILVDIYKG